MARQHEIAAPHTRIVSSRSISTIASMPSAIEERKDCPRRGNRPNRELRLSFRAGTLGEGLPSPRFNGDKQVYFHLKCFCRWPYDALRRTIRA
jgi:hypothetical protein